MARAPSESIEQTSEPAAHRFFSAPLVSPHSLVDSIDRKHLDVPRLMRTASKQDGAGWPENGLMGGYLTPSDSSPLELGAWGMTHASHLESAFRAIPSEKQAQIAREWSNSQVQPPLQWHGSYGRQSRTPPAEQSSRGKNTPQGNYYAQVAQVEQMLRSINPSLDPSSTLPTRGNVTGTLMGQSAAASQLHTEQVSSGRQTAPRWDAQLSARDRCSAEGEFSLSGRQHQGGFEGFMGLAPSATSPNALRPDAPAFTPTAPTGPPPPPLPSLAPPLMQPWQPPPRPPGVGSMGSGGSMESCAPALSVSTGLIPSLGRGTVAASKPLNPPSGKDMALGNGVRMPSFYKNTDYVGGGGYAWPQQQAEAKATPLDGATPEQVYMVQQTIVQLSRNGFSKQETRKVLQSFLAQERVVEAHTLLNLLQQMAMPVDVVMYNLVMTGYKKKRLWQPVLQVLQQMQDGGHSPDAVSYNILIDACGKAGELDRAFVLYGEMRQSGLAASVNTFTSLIDACGKSNQLARACELLDQMQREDVHPNAHTFTTIINACTQSNDLDRGIQVLHRMIECGAQHESGHTSATPYTTLIRACGKALEVDKAFRVLHCMLDVGVRPNVVTFNCLIDACGKASQLDKALKAFKLMQQCHSVPDIVTYSCIVDSFCKAGLVDTALELFKQMRMQNVRPNAPTFSSLLDACVRAGRVEPAFELVRLMQVANVKPTVGVLNSLIDACSQAQMLGAGIEVFNFIKQSGIRANSSTCRAVVEVCAKARDLNKALAVLLDFLQAGERLECSVFNAVMKLCGEMGNMECATRVFELMLQALIAPNSFTYSAFIEACVNGKNSTRALQVLNEMASGGWTAEASSLESIVLVCAQANEPFFSLVRSIPQVETGLCSSEVYQLLCDVAKRAESPGEGESSIIEAISKLQQLSPSTESPAEKTHHSIHMLQTYLRLRQKQSVALGNPIHVAGTVTA